MVDGAEEFLSGDRIPKDAVGQTIHKWADNLDRWLSRPSRGRSMSSIGRKTAEIMMRM